MNNNDKNNNNICCNNNNNGQFFYFIVLRKVHSIQSVTLILLKRKNEKPCGNFPFLFYFTIMCNMQSRLSDNESHPIGYMYVWNMKRASLFLELVHGLTLLFQSGSHSFHSVGLEQLCPSAKTRHMSISVWVCVCSVCMYMFVCVCVWICSHQSVQYLDAKICEARMSATTCRK